MVLKSKEIKNKMNTKILVVGDDVSPKQLIKDLLTSEGYSSVILAGTGVEGLEMSSTNRPDLVILAGKDLPDMDGEDLIRLIRDMPKSLPCKILAMSGYDQVTVEPKLRKAGADEFLSKPFGHEYLLRVVKALLA